MSKQLKFSLFLLLVVSTFHAQQWNVFNKAYRYNYKADNSPIVTNVLFADSVKQNGSDTIYYLNRIVTQCLTNCLYDTTGNPSHKYYYANMPQFLQRSVKKLAGGMVKFYDTTSIYIKPFCSLNETWTFDSTYNIQALCTNISTQSVFGFQDSVKTILLNNTDTIKLSKSFGLIVFPEPYGKNKYYRMSGIEWKNSYDQTSLFGEKVPNAWDFYDYQVGDIFCITESAASAGNGNHTLQKVIINSKTIIPTGYSYSCTIYTYNRNDSSIPFVVCGFFNNSVTITYTYNLVHSNFSNPLLNENNMYPGKLVTQYDNANIVQFGNDQNGKFYKFFGKTCNTYSITNVPNSSIVGIHSITPVYYKNYGSNGSYPPNTYNTHYTETYGRIAYRYDYWEGGYGDNLTSFVRNGTTYFGQPNVLSVAESANVSIASVFPSPANDFINVQIDSDTKICIFDLSGNIVLSEVIRTAAPLDISKILPGLYIISLTNDHYSSRQKLIISR